MDCDHDWETTHYEHERDDVPVGYNSRTDGITYATNTYHAQVEQTCTKCGSKRELYSEDCHCEQDIDTQSPLTKSHT